MKKKILSIALAGMMAVSLFVGCGNGQSTKESDIKSDSQANDESEGNVKKPDKIKLMVPGVVFTKENGQDKFIERWEELTGIKLEIIQPDHDAYYDVLGQTFASGPDNWPDAVILDSTHTAGYAAEGALWDMADAWEHSELKASGRINNEELIEFNYQSDGKLYNFSTQRGGGCVTYIKKKWLDNCNLSVPTNYEEFINVLKAFSEGDPDGNGINGDTMALSTAGFIGDEIPYVTYLPEFYQGAYPSFYQKEDGTWVDGFTEDSMKRAIERLKDAYDAGYIDKETLTNGTNDCRNKFYEDKFGVFTYWAGTWATNLKTNLEANGRDSELIAIPPIKEAGKYLERSGGGFAITAACKNPEGVYKYLLESMLDGGDMQTLWTYGVEGTHWSTKAETVCGNTYQEGEFHMLESMEKPGTQYTKNNIDPMLSIGDYKEEDPGANQIASEAKESQQLFNSNSKLAPKFISTDEMGQYNGDLTTLKNSIVADVITQGVSVEEGYDRFEKEGGADWSKTIVDSLNALNK
ncbi:extracellular solute-binding protein [Blautia liquoris]|uniref:Extracellular solute-binding protein n=1 Tax=Blautia liquoris TaxID=2779518 RepID=A0A7M2RFY2_9FIRM|nr:extracellular solute-binding protein [Blautia liquoris]QOV18467.1 extracellular solute-binding protein [Blautia liquoris]